MTDPLFVADLDALKAELRLSELPSSTDANTILDRAILDARISFNRRLGGDRVSALVAITEVPNPGTDEEILRSLASSVEVRLVRCYLMRTLPHAFMDASGDINKRWNEEAPFREKPAFDIDQEIERCMTQLEEDFQMLALEDQLGSERSARVYDGKPDCPPPRPGDSLRVRRTYLNTWPFLG